MRRMALPLLVLEGAACEVPNPAFNINSLQVDSGADGFAGRDGIGQQPDGRTLDAATDPRTLPDNSARVDIPGDAGQPEGEAGQPDTSLRDTTPDGPPLPVPANLLEGLVGYWPLDEGAGNRAGDRAGNNHGRLEHADPGAAWRAGLIGGAVAFDAPAGAAIEIAPTSVINRIQSAFTIAAWVFPRDHDGFLSVFSRQFGDGTAEQYDVVVSRNQGLFFTFDADLNRHVWLSGARPIPNDTWTHLAVSYDGATARLYVNGIQDGTLNTRARLQSDSKPVFIGTNINMGTYDRRETFHGLIDEVALYARALAPEEIVTLAALRQPLR